MPSPLAGGGGATIPSSVPHSRASPSAHPALPAAAVPSPARTRQLWGSGATALGTRAALSSAMMLAGTGAQALVWGGCTLSRPGEGGRGASSLPLQSVNPALPRPCSLPGPRTPHSSATPRWEESAAINPGARPCCLMSTCTQLWGDHSVHSSGWQAWGKVSVLGSIPVNGLLQPLHPGLWL